MLPAESSALRKMRDRMDELYEENRQLRELLAPSLCWPLELGLNPSEHLLLAILYARAPAVLSKERLHAAMYFGNDDAPISKIITVYISRLRAKLRPHGVEIVTSWASGFSIEPASKRRLSEMLEGRIAVANPILKGLLK